MKPCRLEVKEMILAEGWLYKVSTRSSDPDESACEEDDDLVRCNGADAGIGAVRTRRGCATSGWWEASLGASMMEKSMMGGAVVRYHEGRIVACAWLIMRVYIA